MRAGSARCLQIAQRFAILEAMKKKGDDHFSMKAKGILFTVISALLFGVTPVLASLTYQMGSNPETLTFYRNLLAVPVIFAVLLVQRADFRISRKQLVTILPIGLTGCGVTTLMLYASYQYVGIGAATTLHFMYPVFVALICLIFFKEKLSGAKLFTLLAATCGIALFFEKGAANAAPGILLAVASGLTYAVYMVGLDKTGLKNLNPSLLSFYIGIMVAVGMLLYNIPTGKIVFRLPPAALLCTLVIAVCTSFLGVALLQVGIRCLNASTAAIFCLFEPIASSFAGWLFLHEAMTAKKLLGSAIILAAVAILALMEKRAAPAAAPEQAHGETAI